MDQAEAPRARHARHAASSEDAARSSYSAASGHVPASSQPDYRQAADYAAASGQPTYRQDADYAPVANQSAYQRIVGDAGVSGQPAYRSAAGYSAVSSQPTYPSSQGSAYGYGSAQSGYQSATDYDGYVPAPESGAYAQRGTMMDARQVGYGQSRSSSHNHVSVIQDPDDPNSVIIRTRKKERKKHHKKKKRMNPALKVFFIILAVLVAIVAAAGIALAIAINQGNLNVHRLFSGSDELSQVEGAKTSDDGQVVEYKGHTYKYNENIASVVLIGHDDESNMGYTDRSLADTIVLFTIDTATNKVRATVVPRNSWVEVDLYDDDGNRVGSNEMQITLSHGVKLPPEGCAANTTSAVARVFFNMPIHYYFDFGRDAVEKATSAVGGVQVKVLEAIPGENFTVGETVLLEGPSAYRYVQYREKDKDESALDRQDRQIQFMKAFAAKVVGMGPQGVYNVYTGASDNIVTNLGASEVAYLASCFATGDNAELEISALKGTTKVGREADGVEYERYYLDKDSVMENTLAAFYTQID